MKILNVANDFSKTPFGRYKSDGDFSAELFRETKLIPIFSDGDTDEIIIDFTGIAMGLGSSFLEEAFGGMVRCGIDEKAILNRLEIKSKLPIYKDQVIKFIKQAASAKQ